MKLSKILLCALCALSFPAFAASKKSIVCVTYPQYDWVMNILGSSSAFTVTLLQDNGTDIHSYQPSVKDVAKISSADLVIYVGGESDEWVSDAVKNPRNKKLTAVSMLEVLGDRVREEEIVEGMQAEGDEDGHHHHDADDHDEHDHDEEIEYDEHVWLSLKCAASLVSFLSEKIQSLDPAKAASYQSNTAAYLKKLSDLDADYAAAVASSAKKTVLFGDRFPFRYLTDDYGIRYYAAFVGCSAESEASFETVIFLARKTDELGLPAVLTIEKGNRRLADTIVKNTNSKNQKILELDSLQSVTKKDIKAGRTYLSAMRHNLEVLKEALK